MVYGLTQALLQPGATTLYITKTVWRNSLHSCSHAWLEHHESGRLLLALAQSKHTAHAAARACVCVCCHLWCCYSYTRCLNKTWQHSENRLVMGKLLADNISPIYFTAPAQLFFFLFLLPKVGTFLHCSLVFSTLPLGSSKTCYHTWDFVQNIVIYICNFTKMF